MKTAHQKTIESYDKAAAGFGSAHPDRNFYKKQIEFFAKNCRGKKIIDIGCGEGRDAVLFIEKGFDYIGIDASAMMVRQARDNVKNGKFIQMDFYNLDFPAQTFDGFWAAASILHAPKKRVAKLLRNIGRILKKEGVGFISLRGERESGEGIVKEPKYGGVERYFSYYSDNEFGSVLNNAGFCIIAKDVVQDFNKLWVCYFVKKR